MRVLVSGLAGGALLLLGLGFFGALHPALDTLALGRPIFALVCVLGVLASRTRRWRLAFLAGPLVALVSLADFLWLQADGTDVTLYSKNLYWVGRDQSGLVADITASGAEFVMLQEVSFRNETVLDALRTAYPHQHTCRFNKWSGISVLSRIPFDGAPVCSARRAIAAAPVQVRGERVWMTSVHIPWPWPTNSAPNEADAFDVLAGLDGHKVLAGDFNTMPWTARVARLARATGTTYAGPLQHTYTLFRTPISIDHVLAPGGGTVERRPLFGSDHAGLLARVNLGL